MAGAAPDGVSFVEVAGGRRLAWSEYGDPAGAPALWHHGGLSCHLDAARAHQSALEAGVRLLAPDRPGIGRSDRDPGRTVASWGADVDLPAEAVVLWQDGGIASFAHGYAGTVDDYRAFGSPDWGFALTDVTVPVDCWQGADDDLVPRAHAERLAGSLPDSTLRVVPGSGHFLPSQPDAMAQVLRTLVA